MSTAGGYLLQYHTSSCSSLTILATIEECKNAKAALDPDAAAVKLELNKDSPKGCSVYNGVWYFNIHEKGALDGTSEAVCKAIAGTDHWICTQENRSITSPVFAAIRHICTPQHRRVCAA